VAGHSRHLPFNKLVFREERKLVVRLEHQATLHSGANECYRPGGHAQDRADQLSRAEDFTYMDDRNAAKTRAVRCSSAT
jgi:hypothetical protein